ncbi:MAG: hypothetical protein WCJ95_20860 [Mariniphaga sp.]
MTEFQFIENMAFYQRRFEKLHFKLICEMSFYIRGNPVHNSQWVHRMESYSNLITLTAQWVALLQQFNSDLTGVPEQVRSSADGRMP